MRFCKTCGSTISSLTTRRGGFRLDPLHSVADSRAVVTHPAPGVFIEQSPSLMLGVHVVRNGGPEDDLCDECVKIGCRILRDRLNEILGD